VKNNFYNKSIENIYSGPSTKTEVSSQILFGERFKILYKKKGWIKIKNFKNNKNKINYIYVLTPKGIDQKIKLTKKFIKIKMNEYEELNIALKKQQRDFQEKK